MDAGSQLTTILITLGIWSTLSTVLLLLTRRHVKIGMKIWFLKKMGKEPVLIRYHGPNRRVREIVIATKGLGDSIEVRGKKFFIIKDKDGETFFLDQSAMRQRDDDINEVTYNFNTIMASDPSQSEQMVLDAREKWMVDVERYQEEIERKGFVPVSVDNLTKYTDPKRLNKFIEFTYLAAKADALKDANTLEKWVKVGTFAAIGAVIVGVLVWYNLDGKVIPLLQGMNNMVTTMGMGFKAALNSTVTVIP